MIEMVMTPNMGLAEPYVTSVATRIHGYVAIELRKGWQRSLRVYSRKDKRLRLQ